MVLPVVLLASTLIAAALGGSKCPPRENLYPCSCLNVNLQKKQLYTAVTCSRLHDSAPLQRIFHALRYLKIDHFRLFDSFWGEKEGNGNLPRDWITQLTIAEVEILDTNLDPSFGCRMVGDVPCKRNNEDTLKFTAVNSSSSDKIGTLCDTGKGNKYPWTGCMSKLRHFHFGHGKLTTVGSDLFPVVMADLLVLNLTHNHINKVDPNAFKNLPRLTQLDLSHNALEDLTNFFGVTTMGSLEFLDVSRNSIKTIGASLLTKLPNLKEIDLEGNKMVELKKDDWDKATDTLRRINLNENPLHCDCSIVWVNGTFSPKVVLLGTCATPHHYAHSNLRRTSKLVIVRCAKTTPTPQYVTGSLYSLE